MIKNTHVVLVVEDDIRAQRVASASLSPHAEVLLAGSLHKALSIIRERTDLTHVILDVRVPNFDNEQLRPSDTTHGLVRYVNRYHPNAKIYTASSELALNVDLAKLGCNQADKKSAPAMVIEDILKQKAAITK